MSADYRPRLLCCVAALTLAAAQAPGAVFGRVVAIGGHASDLALDESRGLLYVANFTANRIEAVTLSDLSIQRSINVAAQPGAVALSPDGRFLVVAHFGNYQTAAAGSNALTVIDLTSGARQTFSTGAPPLGVAFGMDSKAFVVTATEFLQFDPATGTSRIISTIAGLTAKTLPQPSGTAPAQIVATALGVSGDSRHIYGATDSVLFRYDTARGALSGATYSSSPPLGPRAVSVNQDGSAWMAGWTLRASDFRTRSNFSNVTGALNIGSVQFDSRRGLVYAQMGIAAAADSAAPNPELWIADADNLTLKQRLKLQENLAGRSVLSSDGQYMYAISESGVTVLPVGQLDRIAVVRTSAPSLLVRGSGCDRSAVSQEFAIESDGAAADFTVSSDHAGVRVTPSRGVTPATLRVTVDPSAFSAAKGTSEILLRVDSAAAVNRVAPVRVLVNFKDPDQRGTLLSVPGKLADMIADPERDRFLVLRQDSNEVLVFDAGTLLQVAALKTYNTPTSMAVTFDRRWLLVGNNNSHFMNVFDLETLERDRDVLVGDYVQSVAASAGAILATTRSASGGDNKIHRIDLAARQGRALETLGVFENKIAANSVAIASGNGRSILIAQADGTLMLYDAVQDTFTVSRKETPALLGAYAASNYDKFLVGNAVLNASLVPERRLETGSGQSSGFVFADRETAFRITAPGPAAAGVLQRVDLASGSGIRPTRTTEAPLLANTDQPFSRTLIYLPGRSAVIALTQSGLSVFPAAYDEGQAPPRIDRIVSAADFQAPLAPGGLVSIFGTGLSPVSQASSVTPLPTALAETCLTVNGTAVPMMLASPERINAQLPFSVSGNTTVVLRTSSGVSDNHNVVIQSAAPSVFRNLTAGPVEGIPAILRNANAQPVTLSNPVRRGDTLTIYATGLGATTPAVETGTRAPHNPLAVALLQPVVLIGGTPVEVLYAGLVPGEVGVYQINVRVNGLVPEGMSVPLEIRQGGAGTSLNVRVVD